MNPVLDTIAKRYSCRAFEDRPVERPVLEAIGRAALHSPSAMNRQGWRVVMLADKALIQEMDADIMAAIAAWEDKSAFNRMMDRGGTALYNAPAMAFILGDGGDYTPLDCGIVCQTATLAATSLGVDSCICGFARVAFVGDRAAYYREKLGVPQGFDFATSILLGYGKQPGTPHAPDLAKLTFVG